VCSSVFVQSQEHNLAESRSHRHRQAPRPSINSHQPVLDVTSGGATPHLYQHRLRTCTVMSACTKAHRRSWPRPPDLARGLTPRPGRGARRPLRRGRPGPASPGRRLAAAVQCVSKRHRHRRPQHVGRDTTSRPARRRPDATRHRRCAPIGVSAPRGGGTGGGLAAKHRFDQIRVPSAAGGLWALGTHPPQVVPAVRGFDYLHRLLSHPERTSARSTDECPSRPGHRPSTRHRRPHRPPGNHRPERTMCRWVPSRRPTRTRPRRPRDRGAEARRAARCWPQNMIRYGPPPRTSRTRRPGCGRGNGWRPILPVNRVDGPPRPHGAVRPDIWQRRSSPAAVGSRILPHHPDRPSAGRTAQSAGAFGILGRRGLARRWREVVMVGGPARLAGGPGRPVGEAVSVDSLVEDLYGDRQPLGAGHALQSQISRLRRTLAEVTSTHSPPATTCQGHSSD